ncbi:MAG: helix-turn-helix domain-containing protein [Pseudonocardiaceae bacterium]|nr:helix-turn-helix domain-containing protein [Pseudonocardiaceae bacterium]
MSEEEDDEGERLRRLRRRAVGQRVRQLRRARDVTQDELADRSGMSRAWLAHLERSGGNPTMDTLYAIADALSVHVSDLLDDR